MNIGKRWSSLMNNTYGRILNLIRLTMNARSESNSCLQQLAL
jgi:hypothetical protein